MISEVDFFERREKKQREDATASYQEYRRLIERYAHGKLSSADEKRLDAIVDTLNISPEQGRKDKQAFQEDASLSVIIADGPEVRATDQTIENEGKVYDGETKRIIGERNAGSVAIQFRAASAKNAVKRVEDAEKKQKENRQANWQLFSLPDPATLARRRHFAPTIFGNPSRQVAELIAIEQVMRCPSVWTHLLRFDPADIAPLPNQTSEQARGALATIQEIAAGDDGRPVKYLMTIKDSERVACNADMFIHSDTPRVAPDVWFGRQRQDSDREDFNFRFFPAPGVTAEVFQSLLDNFRKKIVKQNADDEKLERLKALNADPRNIQFVHDVLNQ